MSRYFCTRPAGILDVLFGALIEWFSYPLLPAAKHPGGSWRKTSNDCQPFFITEDFEWNYQIIALYYLLWELGVDRWYMKLYMWYTYDIYIYYIRNNTYNLYETRSWHPWRGVLQSCERSLASWISCNTCAETPKWPSPPSNFSFTITTARRAKSFPSSSWKRCAGCGNPQHQMQYIWNTTYWIAAQSSSRRIPQIGCVYYGCQFCEKTWKLQKCCWGTEISRALCPKWFPPSSGHSIYHSFNPSLTKSLWLSVTPSSWLGGKPQSCT